MIAKAIKGRGFRGALAYDLGKEQGRRPCCMARCRPPWARS